MPLSSLSTILPAPLLRDPLFLVALFMAGSLLMLWRLERLSQSGLDGTVIGTLIMPYCSGIGNLVFVFEANREGLPGSEVVVNALVNNVTNMTLLLGVPAVLWGSRLPKQHANRKRKAATEQRMHRLSIFLTLLAVLFFTGAAWALGADGAFTRNDGLVLIGLFLFWQCFQVYDVLKTNAREQRSLSWWLTLDFLLLLLGALDVYLAVSGLVEWIGSAEGRYMSRTNAGWLSGWLMVLPNALLALYYGWRRKPEVVYTSQIGDGHICIPLGIGLATLLGDVTTPAMFQTAILILSGSVVVHFAVVSLFGQLPRAVGILLILLYVYFVRTGLFAGQL
jgi:cation:H+ antiporter